MPMIPWPWPLASPLNCPCLAGTWDNGIHSFPPPFISCPRLKKADRRVVLMDRPIILLKEMRLLCSLPTVQMKKEINKKGKEKHAFDSDSKQKVVTPAGRIRRPVRCHWQCLVAKSFSPNFTIHISHQIFCLIIEY